MDEAANTGVGLSVVAARGEVQAGMNPPLNPADPMRLDGSNIDPDWCDLHSPLGVVQVFSQNGRTVLAMSAVG